MFCHFVFWRKSAIPLYTTQLIKSTGPHSSRRKHCATIAPGLKLVIYSQLLVPYSQVPPSGNITNK